MGGAHSDILTPLPAFGIDFDIDDDKGPLLATPITSKEGVRTPRYLVANGVLPLRSWPSRMWPRSRPAAPAEGRASRRAVTTPRYHKSRMTSDDRSHVRLTLTELTG